MPLRKPFVIGSVPYLNARPLVAWFTDTDEGRASKITVVEAVPSVLEPMLERGEIEAALLSSVQALRHPERATIPTGIACDGAVESVRIFTRVPVAEVKTVALDTSSLTSVALTKIILADLYGLSPEYVPMEPDKDAMLAVCDASLLIGDLGYRDYDGVVDTIDLGAAWRELAELPFVYAQWIGRGKSLPWRLMHALDRAEEWGTANLEAIAERYAAEHGESVERATHYLCDVMDYGLGSRFQYGLAEFKRRLERHDLL